MKTTSKITQKSRLERILFTNLSLAARSGTELHVRDLANSFLKQGVQTAIYSPFQKGDLIDELLEQGVELIESLELSSFQPDLIYGHHHPETMSALMYHSGTPAIFVCHDGEAWHDRAPMQTYQLTDSEIEIKHDVVQWARLQDRPSIFKITFPW